MYSMWNCDFFELEKYIFQNDKNIPVSPFYFKVGDKLKTKFKLEELDLLTSRYLDQELFYNDLLKYKNNYITNNNPNIIITHQRNKKLYQDEVIYNDFMISSISSELLQKKRQNKDKKKKKIIISNSEILLDFIEYIKSLVFDDILCLYLLNPKLLDNNVSLDEKYKLDRLVKGYSTYSKTKPAIHKNLKELLMEYFDYSLIYENNATIGNSNLDVVCELNNLDSKINYIIRSDYQLLRNLVAWENVCLSILERTVYQNKDEYIRNKEILAIEKIKMQKKYRNGEITQEKLSMFYEHNAKVKQLSKKK